MSSFPIPPHNTRIGFHYFPDTDHYREADLRVWLPELSALGASWLTLVAPYSHAIPEHFIAGLVNAGVEPILHIHLPLDFRSWQSSTDRSQTSVDGITARLSPLSSNPHILASLALVFSTYARWGAHYVVLFDRPNSRSAWPMGAWTQSDLVERFLDRFIPIAKMALDASLIPVFPPLDPGGDYWDIAFLRAALQSLERRGETDLLQHLVFSAIARPGTRPLNWGSGGPERWPGARPYFTPVGSEDHLGFRIFDWYLKIAEAATGRSCICLLFGIGEDMAGYLPISADRMLNSEQKIPRATSTPTDLGAIAHSLRLLTIAQVLTEGIPITGEPLDPISPQVMCGNFWLLTAPEDHPAALQAWYQTNRTSLPIAGALRQWMATRGNHIGYTHHVTPHLTMKQEPSQPEMNSIHSPNMIKGSPHISHYLLLPLYEWGIADWYLDAIRPFIKKYQPTVGFSLEEAAYAQRVTVIGGEQSFPESSLNRLRSAGCLVERIEGNGTSIATRLRES